MARPTASNSPGLAVSTALRVADGAEGIEALLRLALEVCDGERAFLAVDRAHRGAADLRVVGCSCSRDDRKHEPSRSVLRRALATTRPWSCVDASVQREIGSESVRALALRSIVVVPVPVQAPARAALVIDSRRIALGAAREAEPALQELAALVALVLRTQPLRVNGAGAESGTGEAGDSFVSSAYREMRAWLRRVAPTDLPVLIAGESGSGKEGVSRTLHRWSRRHAGPFLAVNCAALTETLLEAELFGAMRGAYTGADRDRPGLFALAGGGTLLLDEVADMPAAMQAKLLRVLEERRVRPVGGAEERPVDTRVLAATHGDLAAEVARGRFRADLYHRLAVLRVDVPPLRHRTADLPQLVADLAPRLHRETGFGPPRISAAAWQLLAAHDWPGNVRELHAVLARAVLRAEGAEIAPEHLAPLSAGGTLASPAAGASPLERTMIEAALAASRGSVTAAAARIGWSRQKLYRRMRVLRLSGSESCTTSSDSSTFQ